MKHYARQYCSNTECPTPSNCAVNGCHSPINPVGTVSPQPAPPSYRCARCGHQQQDHGADGCSDAHRIWESARLDSMKWLRCSCKAFAPPDVPPQPAEPTGAKKEWRSMDSAPTNGPVYDVELRLADGRITVGHYAFGESGEDQPPFRGWFERTGTPAYQYFSGVQPVAWRPLASHPAEPERGATRNG